MPFARFPESNVLEASWTMNPRSVFPFATFASSSLPTAERIEKPEPVLRFATLCSSVLLSEPSTARIPVPPLPFEALFCERVLRGGGQPETVTSVPLSAVPDQMISRRQLQGEASERLIEGRVPAHRVAG